MENKKETFIQLPQDITDPSQLRMFLSRLVELLDIAFGNRGDNSLNDRAVLQSNATTIDELRQDFNKLVQHIDTMSNDYVKLDSSNLSKVLKYKDDSNITFSEANHIVSKGYVDKRIGNVVELPNRIDSSANLATVIGKVNDLIDALKASTLFK